MAIDDHKIDMALALLLMNASMSKQEFLSILNSPEEDLPVVISAIQERLKNLPVELKQTETLIALCIKKDILNSISPYLKDNYRKLSDSAFEVLAIIAYYQPIRKSDIDRIRGVDSESPLETLRKLNLIKATPLKEPGTPLVFTTTDYFLKKFGLTSLSELPKLNNTEKIENLLKKSLPDS
jgi:segregation and condensation protein B